MIFVRLKGLFAEHSLFQSYRNCLIHFLRQKREFLQNDLSVKNVVSHPDDSIQREEVMQSDITSRGTRHAENLDKVRLLKPRVHSKRNHALEAAVHDQADHLESNKKITLAPKCDFFSYNPLRFPKPPPMPSDCVSEFIIEFAAHSVSITETMVRMREKSAISFDFSSPCL